MQYDREHLDLPFGGQHLDQPHDGIQYNLKVADILKLVAEYCLQYGLKLRIVNNLCFTLIQTHIIDQLNQFRNLANILFTLKTVTEAVDCIEDQSIGILDKLIVSLFPIQLLCLSVGGGYVLA